jgi:competence protein ComEC
MVVTGTAVWSVTAPVVASWFHLVSPVGLVLNPLIAPLVAVAMAWGFLCLVAAPMSTAVAAACGWGCDATLRCIDGVVGWAAGLPGGYWWVAGPPAWWVVGWYLLLAVTLLVVSRERLTRVSTWGLVAAAWVVVGCAGVAVPRLSHLQHAEMRAVVAAMGHGCGIVVKSPTGRCLVYDAGRLGAPSAARRAMTAVLWHEGVVRIDTLVISHADTDHFNAVPELLERFAVGEILVPPPFLESESWAVGEVLRLARTAGIPVRTAVAGDSFALDQLCRVRVLHPERETARTAAVVGPRGGAMTDNETSLVIAVESAGRRMLLTGDLEGKSLGRFLAADPDSCDVLVAPHHGSRTSLPPDIARVTAADWVIVSGVGAAGWPEVREAYAGAREDGGQIAVVKTGPDDQSAGGAIAVAFTASAVRVAQFVKGRWRDVPAAKPQATPGFVVTPFAPAASGRVSSQPAAISSSWLATKPASSMSTPLVKP